MKKLVLMLAVLAAALGVCPRVVPQTSSGLFNGVATNSRGLPAGGVYWAICAANATEGTMTTPCSSLASIYFDAGLTQPMSNNGSLTSPLTTDGLGNFSFYAAPGYYTIQFYGPLINLTFRTIQVSPSSGSSGSATPSGSQYSVQINAGGTPAALGGVCPPSGSGLWFLLYNMPTATAVAPTCLQGGLTTRDVTGSTATDTILGDGNATNGTLDQVVIYTSTAANVAVSLPTPTTLGNLHATLILVNRTPTTNATVTVTPAGGLTIQGGSTLVINQSYAFRIYVDVSGNWAADSEGPQWTMGSGMSQTCTATGCQLNSSGNLVPQYNGNPLMAVTPLDFINGTNTVVTNPAAGEIEVSVNGPIPNATLQNSSMTLNCSSTSLGSSGAIQQATAIPNASSTGTSANHLAKLTGAPYAAVITAITDTSGAVGVVACGAGTSGNAIVQQSGIATVASSNSVTTGDYAQQSTTTAGSVMDVGSGCPASGQVIGKFTETGASGLVTMEVFPPGSVPCPQPIYCSSTSLVNTTIATSATQILTVSCTMPNVCPCRAIVSYAFIYSVSSQQTVGAWVTDTTNVFANSQAGVNAANLTSMGLEGHDISTVTYSSGASVTFSVDAETSGGTVTAAAPTYSSGPPYLHVLVIPSN